MKWPSPIVWFAYAAVFGLMGLNVSDWLNEYWDGFVNGLTYGVLLAIVVGVATKQRKDSTRSE